ncbi:MAG: hypothetical protein ACM31L_04465 [Actinomycetota bacterium]
MRAAVAALVMLASLPAAAQQQRPEPQRDRDADLRLPYDMVAADRETAWRINRATGEVLVCRVDTTRLEGPQARCTPAQMTGQAPQQSMTPSGTGVPRP